MNVEYLAIFNTKLSSRPSIKTFEGKRQGMRVCHPPKLRILTIVIPASMKTFEGKLQPVILIFVIPAKAGIHFMNQYGVYILARQNRGTLYIGVTNHLSHRVFEHKQGLIKGFTRKYKVDRLVYVEWTSDIRDALQREKNLKEWKRLWKIELIERSNPQWNDLYETLGNENGSRLSPG